MAEFEIPRTLDAEDPLATIVEAEGGDWSQALASREETVSRLQHVLVLPEEALAAIEDLDPSCSGDDILEFLYHEQHVINKEQFLAAHAHADIDVTQQPSSAAERYQRLGWVDEGAVGEVFVARDLMLRRKVAVKRSKSDDDKALRRFLREAQITAQLDHPNIIPIYSFESGDTLGGVAYAMKLVRGRTLRSLIVDAKGEPEERGLRERLELFVKVCDAMIYAHSKAIIHRDLKPENIMVGEFGEVYVMDWGIARFAEPNATETRKAAGTPLYMSPEQAQGHPSSLRTTSDIYSLGLILFELCTLNHAISGVTGYNAVFAAGQGQVGPFLHHHPGRDLSPDLEAIVTLATQNDIASRYPTVQALADDVRRFLRGSELHARPDNAVRKVLRWIVNHSQSVLIIVLTLIVVATGAVSWSLYSQNAAIEEARHREKRITTWQSEVAAHAAEIDSELLVVERAVLHLGRSVVGMLSQPHALYENHPFYFHNDIESGRHVPPDFEHAPAYKMKLSFEHPMFTKTPGTPLQDVRETLNKLTPLKQLYRDIHITYRYPKPHLVSREDMMHAFRNESVPLRWTYIGLEKGLNVGFPASVGLGHDFDPRQRPWYLSGVEGRGAVVWGKPYYGVQLHMLGLPAVVAMYDDDTGALLGVAGVEILVEQLILKVLTRSDIEGSQMALLDAEGHVLTDSAALGTTTQHESSSGFKENEVYPHTAVVRAVRAEEPSGYVELDIDGVPHFVSYHRIPRLQWTYVETIRSDVLLSE